MDIDEVRWVQIVDDDADEEPEELEVLEDRASGPDREADLPQRYRLYVGGGGFAIGGAGVGAVGGFHKVWPGEAVMTLQGASLVVPQDAAAFLPGLPAGDPALVFCSDTGLRVDLWRSHEVHPTFSAGLGYALLLPYFASGLTGFGSVGAAWHTAPTMTLEASLETRTIWFFDDPVQQIGAAVGARF